jgi:hypothetical protein
MLDKINGTIIAAALSGVPAWLVWRAWRRYFALEPVPAGEIHQMRIGLTLLSISLSLWLILFITFLALVIFPLNSRILEIRNWIPIPISLPAIGLINLLLCVGGIVCARYGRRSAGESLPLRKAMGLAGGWMIVPWLLMMSNPH